MHLPPAILTSVRDQLFNDWAVPVTFRDLTLNYNPVTGQQSEVADELELLAVVGPVRNEVTSDAAAVHHVQTRAFLIRSEDRPATAAPPHSSVVHAGVEYFVDSVESPSWGDLLVLHCHARQPATT